MRKGGIDCIVCMFGAPFPECCMKDCGTKEECKKCTWPDRANKVKEKENQEDGKEKKMD